jgi:transposase
MWVLLMLPRFGGAKHIAKSVFQVHGVDAEGNVLIRRQLKRRYIPGILPEAAAMPSWYRGLCYVASLVARAQALGHTVRLMPPAYVKPYVKRQKNDAADAEAICEAVTRANMRFVETKTPEQQSYVPDPDIVGELPISKSAGFPTWRRGC